MARGCGVRATARRRALNTGKTLRGHRACGRSSQGREFLKVAPSIVAVLGLLTAVPAAASETVTYVYDPLGRLVQVARSGTVNNGATACYTYDPASNRSNVAARTTSIACGAGAGTGVTFSISSNGAVTEGANSVFTVTKSGTYANSLTIAYGTSDGTAVSGSDYTTTANTLTFLPTDTTKTITVPTINNTLHENTETFSVTLTNPVGGGALATASGTINDDDAVNQPPVTQADSDSLQCNTSATVNLTANDTDPEGNYPLTLTGITGNVDAGIISASSVQVNAGWPGTFTSTYTVQDSLGNASTGTLTITVTGVPRVCGSP
jgi:chitinase